MCHGSTEMIVRIIVDIDMPDDQPRVTGEVRALLAHDGDRAKYFKSLVNRSTTENDSLKFVKIESRY